MHHRIIKCENNKRDERSICVPVGDVATSLLRSCFYHIDQIREPALVSFRLPGNRILAEHCGQVDLTHTQ